MQDTREVLSVLCVHLLTVLLDEPVWVPRKSGGGAGRSPTSAVPGGGVDRASVDSITVQGDGNDNGSRRSSLETAMPPQSTAGLDANGNPSAAAGSGSNLNIDTTQTAPAFKEGNRFRYHFARLHRVQDLRLIGLVKDLDAHAAALIHQGRKAHQHLPLAADLHELRQLAKVPAGVQSILSERPAGRTGCRRRRFRAC